MTGCLTSRKIGALVDFEIGLEVKRERERDFTNLFIYLIIKSKQELTAA